MKRLALLLCALLTLNAHSAEQTIGLGASANDDSGDPARTAFGKINSNFDEVYGWTLTCNSPITGCGLLSSGLTLSLGTIPASKGGTGQDFSAGSGVFKFTGGVGSLTTAPTGALVGTTDTQTLTNKTLTSPAISSPTGLSKADVGLGNVDNTSDATKNSATATLSNKTLTAPVINSPTGLAKADVGLNLVDNTSDATKSAATATLSNKSIDGGSNTLSNISAGSITGLAASATTDATNASNIGSGTLNAARLPALGGDVTSSAGSVSIAAGAVTDAKASLAVKPAVTVVATANVSLSGLPTIDGVTVVDGSVVLATAQTTGSQNGPWVSHSGSWTRPAWYPSGGTSQAFAYITTLVRVGTLYQGTVWRETAAAPITIDTTATTWSVTPLALNANTVTGTLPTANGGYKLPDLQTFAGSGTWTKPAGGQLTRVFCLGGGGGGGGGNLGGTQNSGGAAGGAGYMVDVWAATSVFGSTEAITIGAGGGGGSANGSAGGNTTFGSWFTAGGGGSGAAGPSGVGAGGGATGTPLGQGASGSGSTAGAATPGTLGVAGSSSSMIGGGGGAGNNGGSGGLGGGSSYGATGGGGGGGTATGPVAKPGGDAGYQLGNTASNGGAVQTNGAAGTLVNAAIFMGGRGGGGGGSTGSSGTAGGGGAGVRGGGGGGGGSAFTGGAKGNGGNGGDGYCAILTTF